METEKNIEKDIKQLEAERESLKSDIKRYYDRLQEVNAEIFSLNTMNILQALDLEIYKQSSDLKHFATFRTTKAYFDEVIKHLNKKNFRYDFIISQANVEIEYIFKVTW